MAHSFRIVLLLLLVGSVGACAQGVNRNVEAESLVDSARWTLESFKTGRQDPDQAFRANLKTAQGVVIFPNVTKAAFIVGIEGGTGVLLARRDDGTWSYPAFYTLGGPSFGLQAGGAASDVILILRSRGAVDAVLNNQAKFGGQAQMIVGEFGAGVSAATTTNIGADVVGFSHGQGVLVGAALEGSVIGRRNDLNAAYYGSAATPWAIVREGQFSNPQADALRQALATE
jgi:lipid-binding SYLF domain-containing protein